jgi:predicted RND superfamily exporter protein
MIGALIGAGLGLASSIAGGIANRKARKKQEQMIAQQQRENQAWYDRKYNEDPTKRADTVRLLTQMQEQIKNRNKAAKGRQAVMGGTEDSTTAVKEANNKTLADTTSQIVAANDARKDSIEQQYMTRKNQLQTQQMGIEAEKAADTANAVAGVAGTAANIATAIDSGAGGAKKAPNMNVTQEQLNGIAKNPNDVLGLKAKATALPSEGDLNSLGAKLQKIKA